MARVEIRFGGKPLFRGESDNVKVVLDGKAVQVSGEKPADREGAANA